MEIPMTARTKPAARQYALEISRVVDAPRDVAFKIWTTPKHLARWWGPKDFTATTVTLEFREGGAYRHTIHKGDQHHSMSGVYREISAPERIVFTFAWDDAAGQPGDETLICVTFEALGGNKTRVTFQQEPFDTIESRDSHEAGWGECLDRMEAHLQTQ
jgi:uncharacterized protein YndB with AHSA1/START domain